MASDIKTACNDLRHRLGLYSDEVRKLAEQCKAVPQYTAQVEPGPDKGEMIANAMLAYRHLEDARMRLGKVIQAYDGGASVYEPNKAAS